MSIATFISADAVGGSSGTMPRKMYPLTGRSKKKADKERRARKPGWKIPRGGGKKYFEARRNRTDAGKWL